MTDFLFNTQLLSNSSFLSDSFLLNSNAFLLNFCLLSGDLG